MLTCGPGHPVLLLSIKSFMKFYVFGVTRSSRGTGQSRTSSMRGVPRGTPAACQHHTELSVGSRRSNLEANRVVFEDSPSNSSPLAAASRTATPPLRSSGCSHGRSPPRPWLVSKLLRGIARVSSRKSIQRASSFEALRAPSSQGITVPLAVGRTIGRARLCPTQ